MLAKAVAIRAAAARVVVNFISEFWYKLFLNYKFSAKSLLIRLIYSSFNGLFVINQEFLIQISLTVFKIQFKIITRI